MAAPGLSAAEARRQLKRYGSNRFRDRPERSIVAQFLRRFGNPLVLILIAASAISALTGELASFVMITAMVIASVTLDFVQEYRANDAAQKLRRSVQVRTRVVRDGVPKSVPTSQVVPGDVVLLAAGSVVPADGIVLESRDLHVDQAVLTGESVPAEKRVDVAVSPTTELADAANAVFMGTSVVSGTGRLFAVHTGNRTAIGQIAATLVREPAPTAFEVGMRRFGMLIMRLTVLMVLFVLLVNARPASPGSSRSCSRSRSPSA